MPDQHQAQRAIMLKKLAEKNPQALIEIAGLSRHGKSDREINAMFSEIIARFPDILDDLPDDQR